MPRSIRAAEPIDEPAPARRGVLRVAVGRAGSWLKLALIFAWPAFLVWLLASGDDEGNDPAGTWQLLGVLAAVSVVVFALARTGLADPLPAWARRVLDDWWDDDVEDAAPEPDEQPLSRPERVLGAAIGVGAGLALIALLSLVLGSRLADALTQLGGLVLLVGALFVALCREIGRGVVRTLRHGRR